MSALAKSIPSCRIWLSFSSMSDFAEVADIEEHTPVDASPLVDFGLLGSRDHVARGQLHHVGGVTLHESLALGVQ